MSLRILSLGLLLAVGVGCSSDRTIFMGSPHDRYDHNRSRRLISSAVRERQPFSVTIPAYTPTGSPNFPRVEYAESSTAADGMAAAHLVPTFMGVELPLSAEDRDDLLDYLAGGGAVEVSDLQGDLAAARRAFAPIVELLESPELLKSDVVGWAKKTKHAWTRDVRDARFDRQAFAEVIAVERGNFWFALYKLPSRAAFSRLVVINAPRAKQDFDEMRPAPPEEN